MTTTMNGTAICARKALVKRTSRRNDFCWNGAHQCVRSSSTCLLLLLVSLLLPQIHASSVVVDVSTTTTTTGSDSSSAAEATLLQKDDPAPVDSHHHHDDHEVGADVEPHPDPNDEHYEGMIYIGRWHHETGQRVGFDQDNGWRFIMGTSLYHDDMHVASIPEHDLHHEADYDDRGNVVKYHHPDFHHPEKTREQVLKERRHGTVPNDGMPKRYGHVDTHPLDGGITPPKAVHLDPVFLDAAPVTNKEFAKFVKSTYYETEAEKFGWSFVLRTFLGDGSVLEESEVDPEAEHWVAVEGAYWRQPEGRGSSYKFREHHPVVHVSHRDAAEYCTWKGKRLPGEREYEAAARATHFGPSNRTMYAWGNSQYKGGGGEEEEEGDAPQETDEYYQMAAQHANLWGRGKTFPYENDAADGWRGTSPVHHYPPNEWGFYDTTGNVWEWMRGGKHKQRIVRGASYIDAVHHHVHDRTEHQHVGTLGARATLHGTTSAANVGFRCAKAPKRRTEHHYVWHDPNEHGPLAVEDQFGKRHQIQQRGWEDRFVVHQDDDEEDDESDDDEFESSAAARPQKKKVVTKRQRYSDEL